VDILYHHRTLLDGAEGIHITAMIRAFETLGHRVTTVSPGTSSPAHGAGSIAAALRRVLPQAAFELAAAAVSISEGPTGGRLLKRLRPDVVYKRHALNDIGMLKAASAAGIPSVLEVNALYSSSSLGQFEPLRFPRVAVAIERAALELATIVVTVSSPLKALVHELAPRVRRVLVVPNGVDAGVFHPHISGARIREQLSLPQEAVVVGWCGIMRSWHGLGLMLDAIKGTDYFLLLIGDGPERAKLERMSAQIGVANRVRFAGRIPQAQVPEYLAAIDIGVVADDLTRYASPMKLFEYMAMGKPVVAPNLPNVCDVIKDGSEGLLFDAGSPSSLAMRLTELRDADLRVSLGTRGRAQVDRDRNWIGNATQILAAVRNAEPAMRAITQAPPYHRLTR
jgi:glycosyltransferase involved in cell wall biosynthesis